MSTVWFVVARLVRDRSALIGLLLIALLVAAALLAPVLSTHPDDVFELHPSQRLQAPSGTHWLGTDRMGADVYSRLLFGARITILIGLIAVGASLLIGVPIGLVAGYHHGWASDALMRVSDIFLAVPQVVLAIAIAGIAGFLAFLMTIDVPMYLNRWRTGNADGDKRLTPREGLRDVSTRWVVTHDLAEWKDEIAWMSLYFSLAVWSSLALCVFYAFENQLPQYRTQAIVSVSPDAAAGRGANGDASAVNISATDALRKNAAQ